MSPSSKRRKKDSSASKTRKRRRRRVVQNIDNYVNLMDDSEGSEEVDEYSPDSPSYSSSWPSACHEEEEEEGIFAHSKEAEENYNIVNDGHHNDNDGESGDIGVFTQPYTQQQPQNGIEELSTTEKSGASSSLTSSHHHLLHQPQQQTTSSGDDGATAVTSPSAKSASAVLAGMKFTFLDPTKGSEGGDVNLAGGSCIEDVEVADGTRNLSGATETDITAGYGKKMVGSVVEAVQTATQACDRKQAPFSPPPPNNSHISSLSSQSSTDVVELQKEPQQQQPAEKKRKRSKLKMRRDNNKSSPNSLSPQDAINTSAKPPADTDTEQKKEADNEETKLSKSKSEKSDNEKLTIPSKQISTPAPPAAPDKIAQKSPAPQKEKATNTKSFPSSVPSPEPIVKKQTPVKRNKKKRKVSSSGHSVASSSSSVAETSSVHSPKTDDKKSSSSTASTKKRNNEGISTANKPAITKESNTAKAATKLSTPPPKKKKRTFQDQVLHTMLISCKPYTLKTLSTAVRSVDTAVNSVMLSLLDKDLVKKKDFVGKRVTRTLYWANQEGNIKMEGLFPNDQEVAEAQQELHRLEQRDRGVNCELSHVQSEPTNDELDKKVEVLEEEIKEMKKRIQEANERINRSKCETASSAAEPARMKPKVPYGRLKNKDPPKPKTPKQLKKDINAMRLEWKKRKDLCTDFVNQLSDAMEKRVKDVIGSKVLDLETDEMMGVTLPPKHVIE